MRSAFSFFKFISKRFLCLHDFLPRFFSMMFLAILSFFILGCGNNQNTLVIAGSTSMQPVMEKIAESYNSRPSCERKVLVEGGGSSAGIMAVRSGAAQLGMSSRELKTDEIAELQKVEFAFDGLAFIVNLQNPIDNLTISQIRDLFAGKVKSWKELGGQDRRVHLIVREEGSGTRSAFDELVMKEGKTEIPVNDYALVQDSMGAVREIVRGDHDAIGFVSLGAVDKTIVKAISVEGVKPSLETIKTRRYKLIRLFLVVYKGTLSQQANHFLSFATGPEGVKIMLEEGIVGVGN